MLSVRTNWPQRKIFPLSFDRSVFTKYNVLSTGVQGKTSLKKKSNQINTMHRKHPQLYRWDCCYQASTELSTCYLHGEHSITIRVSLPKSSLGWILFKWTRSLAPTRAAWQRHRHLCQINLFSVLVLIFPMNYTQKGLCIQAIQSYTHGKFHL